MAGVTGVRFSGPALRRQRNAAGLSARRLADAAGCSMGWIYDLEHGVRTSPTAVLLIRMAFALECEITDFFDDVPALDASPFGRDVTDNSFPSQTGATKVGQ